jgi:hypothetical protein
VYKEDIYSTLRSAQFLYRQTQTIANWLPLLSRMNTRYVRNGGLLAADRFESWSSLSEPGDHCILSSRRAPETSGAVSRQVARSLVPALFLGERDGPDGLRRHPHPPEITSILFLCL